MGEVVAINEPQQELSTDLFDEFWLIYPRHIAKKRAQTAWRQLNRASKVAALSALVHWRRIWVRRDEPEFIPYPSSWLKGERWEDELPSDYNPPRPAAHTAAVLPGKVERAEIPEHVKAMLAKLRAK